MTKNTNIITAARAANDNVSPASLLAGMAEFVDLDGPLLLARDRVPAMRYEADRLYPPDSVLWG